MAVVRNASDQPAFVAANEVEHVGAVMVDPAVNEEFITCPDHRDVVIYSDQGIANRRDLIIDLNQGIIGTFLASFGVGRQSLD